MNTYRRMKDQWDFKKALELDKISFALVSQEEWVKDSGNVCCLISELSEVVSLVLLTWLFILHSCLPCNISSVTKDLIIDIKACICLVLHSHILVLYSELSEFLPGFSLGSTTLTGELMHTGLFSFGYIYLFPPPSGHHSLSKWLSRGSKWDLFCWRCGWRSTETCPDYIWMPDASHWCRSASAMTPSCTTYHQCSMHVYFTYLFLGFLRPSFTV